MKRSVIILIISALSIGITSAQYEDCVEQGKIVMWLDRTEYICVKYNEIPEWSSKEVMYTEVIKPIIEKGPSSYYHKGSMFMWATEYEEALRYYIKNYVTYEEEKETLVEILLMENFWSALHAFDKVTIFMRDVSEVEKVYENAINDLNKYGKDNKNYDFYLGRYSFFLGMLYYYDGNYEKALEYIKIAHERYKIQFILPKNFSVTDKTLDYASTINIKIGSELISTEFYFHYFTNQIKDFGGGWRKYNGKYVSKVAVIS